MFSCCMRLCVILFFRSWTSFSIQGVLEDMNWRPEHFAKEENMDLSGDPREFFVVFPDLELNYQRENWLSKRTILAPKNDVVDEVNESLLQKIPGEAREYKSLDVPLNQPDSIRYPTHTRANRSPSSKNPPNSKSNF